MDRRYTAWKKNRKLGDVAGGRKWPKIADKVFGRVHSLERPSLDTECPIYIKDNPSRDFFFPLEIEEVERELSHLPKSHIQGLTHIWLRKVKKSEYETGEVPLASFICGSGVRAVILYPWPKDMTLHFGAKKPSQKIRKMYAPYAKDFKLVKNCWHLEFTLPSLKNLYVELLLLHEIGHHIDQYHRRWTKANLKQTEEFADQYAYERTSRRCLTFRPES